MTTIVTRAGKGSPLLSAEVDSNFTNLNTDKLELGGTFSSGTANSILYLNGSKVLTSGSALTFDGTGQLVVNRPSGSAGLILQSNDASTSYLFFGDQTSASVGRIEYDHGTNAMPFFANGSEQMRLNSTGLGIGTSSPGYKLDVNGAINIAAGNFFRSGSNPLVASNGSTLNYQYAGTTALAWRNQADTTELMRLTDSGNVGIGTSSPLTKMDIKFATNKHALFLASSSYSNGADLVATDDAGSEIALGLGGSTVQFYTVATERARITSGGTFQTQLDAEIYGVTVGRGAGAVSTNTAVGASALAANTTGELSVAVGTQALRLNTTGSRNTAVGVLSLGANTTGTKNAAFGQLALEVATTASENTALGYGALNATTTGQFNTAVGSTALVSNTTASNNTAVGYQALYSQTTSGTNTAVGSQAGYSQNAGINNTYIGYQAGYFDVGSASTSNTYVGASAGLRFGAAANNNNTALGASALSGSGTVANNTGTNNVAIGTNASQGTTSGSNNVAVGINANYATTSGSNNVAIGQSALFNNTTASNNTAVGYQAGYSNTTGEQNTFIGSAAGYSNTVSNEGTFVGWYAGYNSIGAANTFIGRYAGADLSTGNSNTLIGSNSGYLLTTGSKNTILGRYNGNQGGLDIRTANNFIVLSDGDGNPRFWHNGSQAAINSTSGTFSADLTIRNIDGNGSGKLSLAASSAGGGGASSIAMGNNDSGGTAGPNVIVAANRVLQLGRGNSFTGTPGTVTTDLWVTEFGIGLQGNQPSSGIGLAFPATQSASSNANTLDDYEEGTFTPTLSFGGSSTGITYSYQNGLYIKVGRLVFVRVGIVITNKGSGSGVAKFSGFPFTVESISYADAVGPTSFGGMTGLTSPVNIVMNNGSTEAQFRQFNSTTEANLTDAQFTNSSYIYGSFCYNVA